MIVGGYSLHLYCDEPTHDRLATQFQNHEFAGGTKGETHKEARDAGWLLNLKDDVAICPHCRKQRSGAK